MKSKKGPFILIIALLIVLMFIVGVRYGQRVEMTNKTTALILSTSPAGPTATLSPLRFSTYTSKSCGLEFLHPSTVDIVKQSSNEARLSSGKTLQVGVSCVKNPSFQSFFNDKSVVNQQISFQKKTYAAKVRKVDGLKYFYFTVRNPLGASVYLVVEQKLFPLVESSLIFK